MLTFQQAMLKELGAAERTVLPEDLAQRLLVGVCIFINTMVFLIHHQNSINKNGFILYSFISNNFHKLITIQFIVGPQTDGAH